MDGGTPFGPDDPDVYPADLSPVDERGPRFTSREDRDQHEIRTLPAALRVKLYEARIDAIDRQLAAPRAMAVDHGWTPEQAAEWVVAAGSARQRYVELLVAARFMADQDAMEIVHLRRRVHELERKVREATAAAEKAQAREAEMAGRLHASQAAREALGARLAAGAAAPALPLPNFDLQDLLTRTPTTEAELDAILADMKLYRTLAKRNGVDLPAEVVASMAHRGGVIGLLRPKLRAGTS